MKRILSKIRGLIQSLWRKTPDLQTAQGYADSVSYWLSWIAVGLAALASAVVFFLVFALALLPYITMTHSLIAGLIVAFLVGVWVYAFASRPADVVGKASKGLWISNLALKLAKKFAGSWAKQKGPDSTGP